MKALTSAFTSEVLFAVLQSKCNVRLFVNRTDENRKIENLVEPDYSTGYNPIQPNWNIFNDLFSSIVKFEGMKNVNVVGYFIELNDNAIYIEEFEKPYFLKRQKDTLTIDMSFNVTRG